MNDQADAKQHSGLPVEGYKPQTQASIELVNQNKRLEEQVLQQLDTLGKLEDIDKRWLAIGRTELEQAFMAINRSVFKPGRATIK